MRATGDNRPLAIYDTNIVLQATLSPFNVAERAITQADNGVVDAIMSPRLRSEYEEVLRRLARKPKYAHLLNDEIIEVQLARVDAVVRMVPNAPEQIEYRRDPKDAPTINLAIFHEADFIVARDKDLLVLNNDPVFKKRSPRTRVVAPEDFLEQLGISPAKSEPSE